MSGLREFPSVLLLVVALVVLPACQRASQLSFSPEIDGREFQVTSIETPSTVEAGQEMEIVVSYLGAECNPTVDAVEDIDPIVTTSTRLVLHVSKRYLSWADMNTRACQAPGKVSYRYTPNFRGRLEITAPPPLDASPDSLAAATSITVDVL